MKLYAVALVPLRVASRVTLLVALSSCADPMTKNWTQLPPSTLIYELPSDADAERFMYSLTASLSTPAIPSYQDPDGTVVTVSHLDGGTLVISRQLQRFIQGINQFTTVAERSYRIEYSDQPTPSGHEITLATTATHVSQKSIVGSWNIPELSQTQVTTWLQHARVYVRCQLSSSLTAYDVHRHLQISGPVTFLTWADAAGERDARNKYVDVFGVPAPDHGYQDVMNLPMGSSGQLQPVYVLIAPKSSGSEVIMATQSEGAINSLGIVDFTSAQLTLMIRARQLIPH